MISSRLTLTVVISVMILSGCGQSTRRLVGSDLDTINDTTPLIFIMTATFKNNYKPSYQPKINGVDVAKIEVDNHATSQKFTPEEKALDERDTPEYGNRYFIRMGLFSGDYVFQGFSGYSGIFPVRGKFFLPLNIELKSSKPGVYYLGHISATLRESKQNEESAGEMIPLIDQAVTGFSGGTFDIGVSDRLNADMPEIKTRFPALRSVAIQKAIISLPR